MVRKHVSLNFLDQMVTETGRTQSEKLCAQSCLKNPGMLNMALPDAPCTVLALTLSEVTHNVMFVLFAIRCDISLSLLCVFHII